MSRVFGGLPVEEKGEESCETQGVLPNCFDLN